MLVGLIEATCALYLRRVSSRRKQTTTGEARGIDIPPWEESTTATLIQPLTNECFSDNALLGPTRGPPLHVA